MDPFISLEQFRRLETQEARSRLVGMGQLVEDSWSDSISAQQRLHHLRSCLEIYCQDHVDEAVRLKPLLGKFDYEQGLQHFLGLMVPLESAFHRGLADHDILVDRQDLSLARGSIMPVHLILDNIRSAFNVGSILRTAECFGVSKVFMGGYTPTPDHDKVVKTSMGAHASISWESRRDIPALIAELQGRGVKVMAAETTASAENVMEQSLDLPVALVMGNERYGVDDSILKVVDGLVMIPMFGCKNSLNVSVAAGLFCYEARRQWEAR